MPHCWVSKLDSECFPMGNCSRIYPRPWVPIVCSAALELAANQSQGLSYTNKHGIVVSPRAGTQQSNKPFSQVTAGWGNTQSIPQRPSCLHPPTLCSARARWASRPGKSMLERTMEDETIYNNMSSKRSNLTRGFFVQLRVYSWTRARGGNVELK